MTHAVITAMETPRCQEDRDDLGHGDRDDGDEYDDVNDESVMYTNDAVCCSYKLSHAGDYMLGVQ